MYTGGHLRDIKLLLLLGITNAALPLANCCIPTPAVINNSGSKCQHPNRLKLLLQTTALSEDRRLINEIITYMQIKFSSAGIKAPLVQQQYVYADKTEALLYTVENGAGFCEQVKTLARDIYRLLPKLVYSISVTCGCQPTVTFPPK